MSISVRTASHHNHHARQTRSIWGQLTQLLALSRQRRALDALDDHLLSDIGISRSEAIEESQKPMWNVPNHWRN